MFELSKHSICKGGLSRCNSDVYKRQDVFSIEEDESTSAFINYLHITNGAINQAFTFEYKKKLNESKEMCIRDSL